jgi:hypothetical protein
MLDHMNKLLELPGEALRDADTMLNDADRGVSCSVAEDAGNVCKARAPMICPSVQLLPRKAVNREAELAEISDRCSATQTRTCHKAALILV